MLWYVVAAYAVAFGIAGAVGAAVESLIKRGQMASLKTESDDEKSKSSKRPIRWGGIITVLVGLPLANLVFAPYARHLEVASQVDDALASIPLFEDIKKYDPKDYAQIESEMKSQIQDNKPTVQIIALIRPQIWSILQTHTMHASNDAIKNYFSAENDLYKALYKRNDGSCYQLLHGGAVNPTGLVPKSIQAQDMAAAHDAFLSSETNSQPIPTAKEISPALVSALSDLKNKESTASMQYFMTGSEQGLTKQEFCKTNIDFFDEIISMQPEQAGPVLRYLLASKQQKSAK